MKYIIQIPIIMIFLFLSNCEPPAAPEFCNTQDPCSYCYIPEPSASIYSYDPKSIIIFDVLDSVSNDCSDHNWRDNIESVELTKYSQDGFVDTITAPIINDTYQLIDTDIIIGNEYQYEIVYKDFNGEESDAGLTDSLIHTYNGVDSIWLSLINESKLTINWSYNYFEHFYNDIESIDFKLIREQLNEELGATIDTLDLAEISISDDYEYSFIDDVVPGNQMKYSIYMTYDSLQSDIVASDELQVNFPDCSIINWIPLNSHTIYLEWYCSDVINTLAEITLSNQYNEELFRLESTGDRGYFTDDLSNYISDLDILDNIAGSLVEYQLIWSGEGGGTSDPKISTAETFPINHMVYIPSLDFFPFGLDSTGNYIYQETNTDAFYIDLYEMNNILFTNPLSNPYDKWDAYPYDGEVTYDEALEYCNIRTQIHPELELTFTLPSELDWEIAASAKYSNQLVFDSTLNVVTSTYLDKYYYPVSVGNEVINCNYANIESCYGNTLEIGTFDGSNQIYENSISPSGLYDCSGNVREWVMKHYTYPNEDQFNNREILRGGDYNSFPDDVKSTSYIFQNPDFGHQSIGFRTIIYADEYLSRIREKHDTK